MQTDFFNRQYDAVVSTYTAYLRSLDPEASDEALRHCLKESEKRLAVAQQDLIVKQKRIEELEHENQQLIQARYHKELGAWLNGFRVITTQTLEQIALRWCG